MESDSVSVPGHSSASSQEQTFKARFDQLTVPGGKAQRGYGHMTIVPGLSIVRIACTSTFLRRKAQIEYPFNAIANVDVEDRLLSFDLMTTAGLLKVLIRLASEQEALRAQALLPTLHTPDYAELRNQQQNFVAALYRATPTVRVTPTMIGLNIAAFVLCLAMGVSATAPTSQQLLEMGANYWPLTTSGQWWRIVTSMFLHFGILHIALNMWALGNVGPVVERLYGRRFFLLAYMFSGITGGLISMWNEHVAVSAGASGAVFGVFGLLVAYLIRQRGSIPPLVLKPMLQSTLIMVGFNIWFGFTQRGIDNGAHLGGFGGGLLIGILLSRPLELTARRRMFAGRLAMGLIAAITAIVLIVAQMPKAPPGITQDRQFLTLFTQLRPYEEQLLKDESRAWQLQQRRRISAATYSYVIRQNVIPGYDKLITEVEGVRLHSQSKSVPLQDALLDYYRLRREHFVFLSDAVTGGFQEGQAETQDEFNERIAQASDRVLRAQVLAYGE